MRKLLWSLFESCNLKSETFDGITNKFRLKHPTNHLKPQHQILETLMTNQTQILLIFSFAFPRFSIYIFIRKFVFPRSDNPVTHFPVLFPLLSCLNSKQAALFMSSTETFTDYDEHACIYAVPSLCVMSLILSFSSFHFLSIEGVKTSFYDCQFMHWGLCERNNFISISMQKSLHPLLLS